MDRTVLYREIVRLASPNEVIEQRPAPPADHIVASANEVASSLGRLEQHLADVRPAYLSTTAPQRLSERERDEIDYDVQRILQSEHKKLRLLERTSLAEEQASTPKRWFLSDPAKEGARVTRFNHHKGVFVALSTKLKHCSEVFQAIQRVRLSRRLQKAPQRRIHPPAELPPVDSHAQAQPDTLDVPAELQQTLVLENDAVLKDLSEMLDKTHQVEKSMTEIAQLQSDLSTHLSAQTEQIEHLADEAFVTSGEVDGANLQLKKAQQRNKRASKVIIYSSVGIGCLLFIYDWIL